MRSIALIFFVLLTAFTLITCSGGGDGDGGASSSTSMPAINGSAVKGPIDGDEIKPYYFDDTGSEVEIPAANAPVLTDSTKASNFAGNGTDLTGITSPITSIPLAVNEDLNINDYNLWDRGAGRDLVWASLSLKDAAGNWVLGRTVDDFELNETLLDASGAVVAGPTPITFSDPGSYYQFYGPGFWERTITDEKLDIVFIVDTSGTMSDEMPDIRSELHEFVDRLQAQHVDFRFAIIGDDWVPGSQDIFPSDDNTPFPFSGVMEATEIHAAIDDYYLTTAGEAWVPNTGYDSLMLATIFDWRTDPDLRKVIVLITDTVPQSVYGTRWHLDSTAANRTAAELALTDKGFEVYYSQPATKAEVMDHPDMDLYTDEDFNPKAGCTQLSSGEWDCGFASIGNRLDWPFDQDQIAVSGSTPVVDSQYYFAWRSSISGSGTPSDHTVKITIRTPDPDNASATLEQSFDYVPVLETTDLYVNLSNVLGATITEDITIDVFYKMGDRTHKFDWGYQNTTTPGEIHYNLLPVGDYTLSVSYGWGDYEYEVLYYEGHTPITVPSGGMTTGFELDTGAVDIELAKARGLVKDLKYWGVTDKHFAGFAEEAESWMDGLEQNGIDWTDMERIKRFYVAMSGYVNASGYAEVEAERLTEDFEQILLKFRDIIERVRGLNEDSTVVLGISLTEAIARLDLVASGEIIGAKVSVEALKTFAEEKLVPLLIDEIIKLIPAGQYQSLLSTMVDILILGHWDDWPELLETIGDLALDLALDNIRAQVLSEITDELFDAIDIPGNVPEEALTATRQIIEAFANDGYAGISQSIEANANQAGEWVDDIFFAIQDELAAGPVRDFVLPMLQLIVRSAVLKQEIDDNVVIGVLAHFFTQQVIVKPYFGSPVAGQLDDALTKAKAFIPTSTNAGDRRVDMHNDFADFRTRGTPDDMDALNGDAWDALSQQDLIDDMATVLDTLSNIVDTVLYPLFGGLCSTGYPTCAMMDDLRDFTAALDAIGLMTKVVEMSMKTEDLVELKDDVAFINNLVLVE
jgi:phosphate uptake regulator